MIRIVLTLLDGLVLPLPPPLPVDDLAPILDPPDPVVRDAGAVFKREERIAKTYDVRSPDDPCVTGRAPVQVVDRAFVHLVAAPLNLIQDVSRTFRPDIYCRHTNRFIPLTVYLILR